MLRCFVPWAKGWYMWICCLNKTAILIIYFYLTVEKFSDFSVLDPDTWINFSTHLPLRAKLAVHSCLHANDFPLHNGSNHRPLSTQLCCDKTDWASYYFYTSLHLDPLLGIFDDMIKAHQAGAANVDNVHNCTESVYSSVVFVRLWI